MRLLTLAVRNLLRRRIRSLLTILGIAVAIATVISLVGVADGFQRSFLDLFEHQAIDLVVIRTGRFEGYTGSLNEELGPQIRALPGVRAVSGGLMEVVSFEDLDLYGVPVQALQADSFRLDAFNLLAGSRLNADDRKKIMLGKIIARNLGKTVGDLVEVVEDEPYEVVGVYESFNVFENGTIIMLLPELQDLMDRAGQVTAFSVRVTDATDRQAMESLRRRIEDLDDGVTAMPAEQYVRTIGQIRLARSVAWLISAIALVIGSLGMLNTMAMSVLERSGEIGVLRALGWPKHRIVRMILIESELLSLVGAAAGAIAAAAVVGMLGRLPITSGLIDSRLTPQVVGLGFAVSIGVGLIGGCYSAYLAARLLPATTLRHE